MMVIGEILNFGFSSHIILILTLKDGNMISLIKQLETVLQSPRKLESTKISVINPQLLQGLI